MEGEEEKGTCTICVVLLTRLGSMKHWGHLLYSFACRWDNLGAPFLFFFFQQQQQHQGRRRTKKSFIYGSSRKTSVEIPRRVLTPDEFAQKLRRKKKGRRIEKVRLLCHRQLGGGLEKCFSAVGRRWAKRRRGRWFWPKWTKGFLRSRLDGVFFSLFFFFLYTHTHAILKRQNK